MAIGTNRTETTINALENVVVTIKDPTNNKNEANPRAHSLSEVAYRNACGKVHHHGVLKLIDRKTGVFSKKLYTVKLTEDAGGPIDDQYFMTALSKKLSVHEEFKDYQIKFEDFVGFSYIQGLNGKFLGEYNEKYEVTLDNAESSRENQAYILHVKGQLRERDMGGREVTRPYVIALTLNTPLYPGDLLGGLVNSRRLKEYLDIAVRQMANKQIPSMDIIDTIEFTQVGRQIALMAYSNNEYWRQTSGAFGYFSDKDDIRVYASSDFLR